MNATRRLSIAALIVACTHLVFGAIVRISGSGMGCGDNWPKCYGYWFPPFSRPDLIVEVSHRYLASILTLTVLTMAFVAFRNRRLAGVGGKGGVLRAALGAVAAVFTAAILGGVTVKMGNAPWATVAHWLVAMTLLAMVATTAIRAGALGGASSLVQRGSARAKRSAFAAAVLAIFAVALGGLTAKIPGAAVGCTTIPMCGPNPSVEPLGVHVQLTHRTIAVLLVLHLIGVVMMLRKRRATEAPVVVRAAHVALGMVLLQLVVASSMILFHLPPVLRSLHEATGVGIWLSCFVLAYLARRASQVGGSEAAAVAAVPGTSAPTIVPTPIAPVSVPRPTIETKPARATVTESSISAASVSDALATSTTYATRLDEAIVRAESVEAITPTELADTPVVVEAVDIAPIVPEVTHIELRADAAADIVDIAKTDDVARVADALDIAEPLGDAPLVETARAHAIDETLIVESATAAANVADVQDAPRHQQRLLDPATIDEPLIAPEPIAADGPIPVDVAQPAVVAPVVTPLPPRPKHTMAVIIARGADL